MASRDKRRRNEEYFGRNERDERSKRGDAKNENGTEEEDDARFVNLMYRL